MIRIRTEIDSRTTTMFATQIACKSGIQELETIYDRDTSSQIERRVFADLAVVRILHQRH